MSRFVCIIAFSALFSGFTINHDYVWKEYPIKSERVLIPEKNRSSTGKDSIEIKSGDSDTNKIVLGHINGTAHYWYGSLQSLTDSIVTQLSSELIKRNYILGTGGNKTVGVGDGTLVQKALPVSWGVCHTSSLCRGKQDWMPREPCIT